MRGGKRTALLNQLPIPIAIGNAGPTFLGAIITGECRRQATAQGSLDGAFRQKLGVLRDARRLARMALRLSGTAWQKRQQKNELRERNHQLSMKIDKTRVDHNLLY